MVFHQETNGHNWALPIIASSKVGPAPAAKSAWPTWLGDLGKNVRTYSIHGIYAIYIYTWDGIHVYTYLKDYILLNMLIGDGLSKNQSYQPNSDLFSNTVKHGMIWNTHVDAFKFNQIRSCHLVPKRRSNERGLGSAILTTGLDIIDPVRIWQQ